MSVREPKSRLLVREGMADHEWMTAFTPAQREWYLLTALFTDDGGYLNWSLEGNAADLYRYEGPTVRVKRVQSFVDTFATSGRVIILECGRHAFMPRVAQRPRGQRREYSVRDEHETACNTKAIRKLSQSKVKDGMERTGKDGTGTDGSKAIALQSESTAPMKDMMQAAGFDPDKLKPH